MEAKTVVDCSRMLPKTAVPVKRKPSVVLVKRKSSVVLVKRKPTVNAQVSSNGGDANHSTGTQFEVGSNSGADNDRFMGLLGPMGLMYTTVRWARWALRWWLRGHRLRMSISAGRISGSSSNARTWWWTRTSSSTTSTDTGCTGPGPWCMLGHLHWCRHWLRTDSHFPMFNDENPNGCSVMWKGGVVRG